jgi:hypothetical protein
MSAGKMVPSEGQPDHWHELKITLRSAVTHSIAVMVCGVSFGASAGTVHLLLAGASRLWGEKPARLLAYLDLAANGLAAVELFLVVYTFAILSLLYLVSLGRLAMKALRNEKVDGQASVRTDAPL